MISLLKQTGIGVDIADNSIEVVQLSKQGGALEILNYSRVRIASGIVENGRILDEKRLRLALESAFSKAKPQKIEGRDISVSLPESHVYTDVIALKAHTKKQREQLVRNAIERSFPLALLDLSYAYRVLYEDARGAQIFVVAASNEVIKEWGRFFRESGLRIEGFDIETLAVFRGIYGKKPGYPVCVLDLGAATSALAIFDDTGLRYSYAVREAGNAFTESIAKTFQISYEEAEQRKQEAGIANPKNEVSALILDKLEPVFAELQSGLEYVRKEYQIDVKEIALAGGSAKLKGLPKYIQKKTGLPVQLGKSAIRTQKTPLVYLGAIGLAVRALDDAWESDPLISSETEQSQEEQAPPQNMQRSEGQEDSLEGLSPLSQISKVMPFPSSSKPKPRDAARRQLFLLGVFGGGIILLSLSFWYRKEEEKGDIAQTSVIETEYGNTQVFEFQVPIAASPAKYGDKQVRGRIIETIIPEGAGEEAFISSMGKELQEQVAQGEKVWGKPLGKGNAAEKEEAKKLEWLVYREDDVARLLLDNVEQLNPRGIKFILREIEATRLQVTQEADRYLLDVSLSISLNELIEFPSPSPLPSPEPVARVVITKTPTGWLNARAGAGTNYEQIGRVYPGEKFVLLEELNGWYKIQLKEDLVGWVVVRHAAKEEK
ncbi:MAG: hypothetical protein A3E07_02125 [Candidatus Wildermuthbacteria bacterium RIFCSPHIGHO2_12_FULL_45_9]|nr:MAG: hypothetical protein A3E07_02125 [Candidatus Wildermuthbacteria bacterium RIFCSPHIGHO2_12_FULL_45_9]